MATKAKVTVAKKQRLVPVTSETVQCQVPFRWLDKDAETWTMDRGFPDGRGRHHEGYFKVPTTHAPDEHDPHGRVVRVRCKWAPEDYWEQEAKPEEGYEPPPSTYRDMPVFSVTPAVDALGEPWWIITTLQVGEPTDD